jgi:diadenosine tetraphosphate (Ap4A) HIT family hydrolase
MDEWKKNRIASALDGTNPTVLLKMKSGFAVIGDTQFLPGYCVLIAYPKVSCLNDLSMGQRSDFLLDMSLIGDAISAVCKPLKINYEILVNAETFLHAHIFPRYEWESDERRRMPVWLYPRENWSLPRYQFSQEKHGRLKQQITDELKELTGKNYK